MIQYSNEKPGYSWYKKVENSLQEIVIKIPNSKTYFDNCAVFLHGSTTTGMSDEYTDLDLWMLLPQDIYKDFIKESTVTFFDFELGGRWGHLNIENFEDFEKRIHNCDFPLIYEMKDSYLILDKINAEKTLYKKALAKLPKEIIEAYFLYHYVEARNWQKSCENIMRRQDSVSLLINIPKVLSHALKAAVILEGEPYPYDKWLPKAAFGSLIGSEIVNQCLEIIKNMSEGSFKYSGDLETNPLFISLEKIKVVLKEGASNNGINSPWIKDWYLYVDEAPKLIKNLSI